MSGDFDGKRVLVTGGSRGIGYATAAEFLARGARVAVNGRTRESTAAAIEALAAGDRVVAAPGDVAKVSECESLVKTAIEGLGGLDILVNNAGVGEDAPMEECDEALRDRTVDVNLKGTFFCARASLEALRSRGKALGARSSTSRRWRVWRATTRARSTARRRAAW